VFRKWRDVAYPVCISYWAEYPISSAYLVKGRELGAQLLLKSSLHLILKIVLLCKNEKSHNCKSSQMFVNFFLFKRHMNSSINYIKNLQYQISGKSVQWETNWSVRTDGRRYITKLVADFTHCCAKVPEKIVKERKVKEGNKHAWNRVRRKEINENDTNTEVKRNGVK